MRMDAEVARHVRLECIPAALDVRNGGAFNRDERRGAGSHAKAPGTTAHPQSKVVLSPQKFVRLLYILEHRLNVTVCFISTIGSVFERVGSLLRRHHTPEFNTKATHFKPHSNKKSF